ncbi:hypothetical protein D7Y13_18480 [Corallococcus praedator]|uniref:DUF4292 domain-containing protein n=1 Tax=Corallococcus praedator TaxID=2316724 RepID=A0ABX9QGU4_9BACT|nr:MULTISPECIES: hypothetical protein [Corallococcus]RKH34280.1 hypothetical protein D7X75_08650 [Corallococcus sp. CA031C]RKI07216.1 hypothetical protein D7Y13_18480 [Corallococcus praedator]
MTSALRPSRRAFTRLLGGALVAGVHACGLSGTGGRSITFRMGLRTAMAPGEDTVGVFTTDTGWRVALTTARMVLGPIYLFEKASPLQPQALLRRVSDLLLPTAHAHEGDFFSGGRVLGEWDREVVFDLLAQPGQARVLGHSPGIAGLARSLSLLLQPPSRALGAEGDVMEGRTLFLEGVATQAEARVPFRLAMDFPPPVELQRVDFVPIQADLDDEGLFCLEAQPHRWFTGTRFDRLTVPAEGTPVDVGPETQVHRALSVNVRRFDAFTGAWEPQG